ncbi:MAG: GTPase Era [Pseudobdellovibrionaceae bacterium]|nr:GTPase Era [Bdellovibrionales bacterium]USN48354.1 MAG: GTPase Era [Pseudobdellovibrionaceae bacterium]
MSYKAGFVGLVGRPNAGKSTLVNYLIGEKVGIVTRKPQTTRQKVLGVYTDEKMQAVFVDAPGKVQADSGLNLFLKQELETVISDSDVLLLVVSVDEKSPEKIDDMIEMVVASKKPWVALINKVDMSQYRHRVQIIKDKLSALNVPVFTGSAKKVDRFKDPLFEALNERLPETKAPLFDKEIYTTQNMREYASEIIREKCFLSLHQEIPYGLAVKIIKFVENEGPTVKIFAEILLNKENHRPMVVGSGGTSLRRIGTASRKELEKVLGRKVFLDLHVRVKKGWVSDERTMMELGYVAQ